MKPRRDRRLRESRAEQAHFAAVYVHACGVPMRYGITDDGVAFYIVAHPDVLAVYRAAGPLRRLELRRNSKVLGIRLPRWPVPPSKAAHDAA
jgi:hypothetical protein